MTPPTRRRRAALEFAAEAFRLRMFHVLRDDPDALATVWEVITPRRKPSPGDHMGLALWDVRDWLRGTAPRPMQATIDNVRRALES